MKLISLALVLLLNALPAAAQKDQIVHAKPSDTFKAAIEVAKANYTVESVSDAARIVSFHTGHSLTSNGMNVSVTFDGVPAGCEKDSTCRETAVHVRVTKANNQLFAFGAGDRIAKKFFGELDKQVKELRK